MALGIYVNTSFAGHYPVGTAAIVIARDRGHARKLLLAELADHGLAECNTDMSMDDFERIPWKPHVLILNDGNY